MLEINPARHDRRDRLIVLDAKMSFDANAMFRHPDLEALRDESEEDPMEVEASKHDLAYVKLDGNIGCMVNGAGLAMATMDIIKLNGAEPANFLDVGGGASKEKVTAAFKIILSDPAVKGILVNIFGGHHALRHHRRRHHRRCQEVDLRCRSLFGSKAPCREGKAMLAQSGLPSWQRTTSAMPRARSSRPSASA